MTDRRDPDRTAASGCPFASSRRQLLLGLGSAAGGALALSVGAAKAEGTDGHQVTDAPAGDSQQAQVVPFYGPHQAGIVTPRPEAGLIVSFTVVAQTRDEVEDLFRRLTERAVFLTSGGKVPDVDPKLPPVESGILGPDIAADALTVTVGLGSSFFDDRDWLKPLKPKRLKTMVEFPNDALDRDLCHGDLSIQFCANRADVNIHALRDLMKNLSDHLVIRWMQAGDVPVIPPKPDGSSESARNFLGFRDGTANPDAGDTALMDRIVWVEAGKDEPEWAKGGSYQAVRIIRNFVERWDRTPLQEQETIFGRQKASGAPFGGKVESDLPDYAGDPDGRLTPLDSHIRLANPRTADTQANLILRRPFNYSNGVTKSGQLDQGLLFIAYQADLDQGFITVQNRLNGEPLEEYIKPVGGGYFYVLPGVCCPGDYLGKTMMETLRA
ncbi:iron uptake transporter deferrochelatase/peroxidase subunit [Rhizobium halophytocola]|uniref:Deferrochelatase n=1 Tax=Rhizobium halophytocola TaxID=735519 RepID=A0ABS4DU60_9HYPH|nr:iron uptake transporter deferrochelatase/peroxidase subunit [Rhizobium halophytocola]MBP1849238.1 deferrochelatase/peroxidase EfeB [Rhizobium halophytocola]